MRSVIRFFLHYCRPPPTGNLLTHLRVCRFLRALFSRIPAFSHTPAYSRCSLFPLLQLFQKRTIILADLLNLLKHHLIQKIAVDIFAAAPTALTALLELADIAIERRSVRHLAFGQLWIHSTAAATEQQSCQYPFTDYPLDILLRLITCPFNEGGRRLVAYWHQCCEKIHNHQPIGKPDFDEFSLEGCEAQYRAYELGYRLAASEEEKQEFEQCRNEVCYKITVLLLKDKASHLSRCKYCGGRLSFNASNGVCASCQMSMQNNASRIAEQV